MLRWQTLQKESTKLAKGMIRFGHAARRAFSAARDRERGVARAKGDPVDITLLIMLPKGARAARYFGTDTFVKDAIAYVTLRNLGLRVRVHVGPDLEELRDGVVLLHYSKYYNVFASQNHVAVLPFLHQLLREQGNTVLPPLEEMLFWENKAHMHARFAELDVPTPATVVVDDVAGLAAASPLPLPFLVKELHAAGSLGVTLVRDAAELDALLARPGFVGRNPSVLVQELVPMTRDLRVTVVDGEIVLHYWRHRPDGPWRPTSTKWGGAVDFVSFPEQWRPMMLEITRKLGLFAAAYDVTWRDDDLSQPPLVLEVSPTFEPNPAVDLSSAGVSYGAWKSELRWAPQYERAFVDILFDTHARYITALARSAGLA